MNIRRKGRTTLPEPAGAETRAIEQALNSRLQSWGRTGAATMYAPETRLDDPEAEFEEEFEEYEDGDLELRAENLPFDSTEIPHGAVEEAFAGDDMSDGSARRVLGRGLDVLIPRDPSGVRQVEIEQVVPDRAQPRTRFDDDRLLELAESIRQHGILQPLIVAPADEFGKYRLIVGERRWQAAQLAGLATVPAIERSAEGEASLELALVENLQRQDLDPLEEAAAFDRLIHEHGLTQEAVAGRVGRSRPAVANSLRLLGLPTPVRQALISGSITEGHARALLGIDDPLAAGELLKRITGEGLNVRQTERLVNALKDRDQAGSPGSPATVTPSMEFGSLENRLREVLGTKVSISKGRKAGKIVIEFYSQDDLDTLLEKLLPDEA